MPLSLADALADLPDPRRKRNQRHEPIDRLPIAACAVLGGAHTWGQIAAFGAAQRDWSATFLGLPNGIPSPDPVDRAFAALPPTAFPDRFGRWRAAAGETTGRRAIATDGTSVRRARRNTAAGGLHHVRAWATANRRTRGPGAVADGSNEIAAIPELLRALDLRGAMATAGAAGTPTESARPIRAAGGHPAPPAKGNRPTRAAAVRAVFDRARAADVAGGRHDTHAGSEAGHGRPGERSATALDDPAGVPAEWPDVAAVALVARGRAAAGKNASSFRDFPTSPAGTAADRGGRIRGHWGIENQVHWAPEVAFREEERRTRDTDAGANFSLLRKVAASLLKEVPVEGGGETKRLRAGGDEAFRLQVIRGIPER